MPIATTATGECARRDDGAADGSEPIKVLVADDHMLVADALRNLVDEESDLETVATTANGSEAVRLACESAAQVVVLDISMPELNGIEATRRIVSHQPPPAVLIVSVHTEATMVQRAFAAGASGYVDKSAKASEFIEAIRQVHRGETVLSSSLEGAVLDAQQRGDRASDPLDGLSGREREVLQLLAEGWKTREIAGRLKLSAKTIETYRMRLINKLGLRTVPELVLFAVREGLIEPK